MGDWPPLQQRRSSCTEVVQRYGCGLCAVWTCLLNRHNDADYFTSLARSAGLTRAQDGAFCSRYSPVGHEPLGGCFERRSLAAAAAKASTAS